MKLIRKLLRTIPLIMLLPLGIMAWGSWFDARGGEPFSDTVTFVAVTFPLWMLVAIFIIGSWLNSVKFRRYVTIANLVLFLLLIVGVFKTRHENINRQERTSAQQH